MQNATASSLVLRQLESNEGAKSVFDAILKKNSEGKNALAAIRDNPGKALALLGKSEEIGLTLRDVANVAEEIIGDVEDPDEARELVEESLITSRRAELLAARGDLPSVLSEIVSVSDVHVALLNELINEPNTEVNDEVEEEPSAPPASANAAAEAEDAVPLEDAAVTASESEEANEDEDVVFVDNSYQAADLHCLRPWALKLKDRSDYLEILELKLDDDITVGMALVYTTSLDHPPEEDIDLFRGALNEIRIDFEDDFGRELIERTSRTHFQPIHVDDLIALRKELIGSDADPATATAQNLTEVASALI